MSPRRRQGFTLLEMLTVIVIIVMLVGILAPMASKAYQKSRILEAQRVAKDIKTAIDAYQVEYGRLPSTTVGSDIDDDKAALAHSTNIIACLTFSTNTVAWGGIPNPKGIRFLSAKDVQANGTLHDPWGSQYRIYLDTDYNGSITLPGNLGAYRVNAIVRSPGPNREDNNDTIDVRKFDDIFTVNIGN